MAAQLDTYNDRTGNMALGGLTFRVRVIRARTRYGHLDLLVTPISGDGERWVENHRVTLDEVLTTSTVEISETLVHEMKPTPMTYSVTVDKF